MRPVPSGSRVSLRDTPGICRRMGTKQVHAKSFQRASKQLGQTWLPTESLSEGSLHLDDAMRLPGLPSGCIFFTGLFIVQFGLRAAQQVSDPLLEGCLRDLGHMQRPHALGIVSGNLFQVGDCLCIVRTSAILFTEPPMPAPNTIQTSGNLFTSSSCVPPP